MRRGEGAGLTEKRPDPAAKRHRWQAGRDSCALKSTQTRATLDNVPQQEVFPANHPEKNKNEARVRVYIFKKQGFLSGTIYLKSLCGQSVAIGALARTFDFKAGELVHIHYAYKYDQDEIVQLGETAGLRLEQQWFDEKAWYSLNLFVVG